MEPKNGEVALNINKIEESFGERAAKLEPLSGDCCIYKVPPRLREPNKEKFTPQMVSIGPYHHRNIEFQPMEEHKFRYLCAFLQRIKMSTSEYIKWLKELEIRLRQSYAKINGLKREEFMEIMAVDGAFLMELLLRFYYGGWEKSDPIFKRQNLIENFTEDLFLIENQVPFFYLKHLFQLFEESSTTECTTLKEIVKYYIRQEIFNWEMSIDDDDNIEDTQVHHLLHFLIDYLMQRKTTERSELASISTPSISDLHRAGVKFKPSSTHCLSSIKFANGVLEIPKLRLEDRTEKIFRNMQAFEHCHRLDSYVGDYIFIMDDLINDEEDIKILKRSGIIDNWLEDNHAAAAVFNNLGKGTFINVKEFSYVSIMEDLDAYYKRRRHRWKAMLKQQHFNNPWTIISVVAGGVLLLLTAIQTACSILEAKGGHK